MTSFCPFSSPPAPCYPLSSSVSVQKGQAAHGCQQSLPHFVLRLTKTAQDGEEIRQNQLKYHPDPTAKSSTNRTNYTTVTYFITCHVCIILT